jgi:hypothetical protein
MALSRRPRRRLLVIVLIRLQGVFQLLINLEEMSLTRINEPFATLAKDVTLQQAHFVLQLLDKLLLHLDRLRLCLNERLARREIVRDLGVECHP